MFGLDITIIAFVLLAALGAGGIIYAFLYEEVSNQARQEKRYKVVQARSENERARATQRLRANDAARRKKTVQDSLKELEDKQRARHKASVGLKMQISQAGLKLSMRQFIIISIACGVGFTLLSFLLGAPNYIVLAAGVVGAFGFPRWMIGRIRAKRMQKFLNEFPNAVDVIVRGVKAGLPINDCLAIIAKEAKEPVSTEFRRVIETQQLGVPLSESVSRLYENVPLTESNFFGIVIAIQQSAGGNLSEALGNLSNVLRDRKKMKAKISAMSAEAKASAGIIAALPFLVTLMVYLTTPDYISILFTDPTGNIILICSGIWMSMGVLVMKKMINFDF